MSFYEHTLIARQDSSPSQIKQIEEKYRKIIESNDGNILKFESWGLMNLSYLIKKNKKGNYLHFKLEAKANTIRELEKNEKLDKNLLRFLTVKVKKIDLETDYFNKKNEDIEKNKTP
jgi:small subunit ribosomal protein S6